MKLLVIISLSVFLSCDCMDAVTDYSQEGLLARVAWVGAHDIKKYAFSRPVKYDNSRYDYCFSCNKNNLKRGLPADQESAHLIAEYVALASAVARSSQLDNQKARSAFSLDLYLLDKSKRPVCVFDKHDVIRILSGLSRIPELANEDLGFFFSFVRDDLEDAYLLFAGREHLRDLKGEKTAREYYQEEAQVDTSARTWFVLNPGDVDESQFDSGWPQINCCDVL